MNKVPEGALKPLARRRINAMQAFEEGVAQIGGLTPVEAKRAVDVMFKLRICGLVRDHVEVRHGAMMDREVLRRLAGLDAAWMAANARDRIVKVIRAKLQEKAA